MNPTSRPASAGSHLTEHLLLLAEHLAQRDGQLDQASLAWTLAQHCPYGTVAGSYGTASVLAQVAQGIAWWEAATAIHNGQGSHGSTSAARVVAAGLLPHSDLGVIAETARRTAVITHTHQWARDGSAVTAAAVALAVHGLPNASITTERFLAIVAGQAHDPEFRHYLSVVRTLTRHRAGPAETIATLSSTAGILRTVPAALTSYLRHPTDPTAAISYALALGGHTRAIAIITAALAGARCPESTPASSWRAHTDILRIHAIAAALASLKDTSAHPWRSP